MLWTKEISNKYCKSNIYDGKVYGQLACQKLCEADSGCVGVTWTQAVSSGCFICQDDMLSNSGNDYGFYRRPLGKNDVYSIR